MAAVLEMRGEQEQCLSWLERLGTLAPTDAGILTCSGAIRAAQVLDPIAGCLSLELCIDQSNGQCHAQVLLLCSM